MRQPYALRWLSAFAAIFMAATVAAQPVAIMHVRLIDGNGGAPIDDATVVIDGGRIVAAGKAAAVPAGARALDYRGRTVMPGIVSDHSHIGAISGIAKGSDYYTRANITAQLEQWRRYGVTTIVSLGNNRPLLDELRQEAHAGRLPIDLFGADQGIGVPGGAPPQALMGSAPDQLDRPATPAEAKAAVDRMAASGTDLVKVWIDNFGDTSSPLMKPEILKAVTDAAHAHGIRVAAHVHDLRDLQRALDGNVDIMAHGVRDQAIPASVIAQLKARHIWYIPTLQVEESMIAWAAGDAWTKTPFARAALAPAFVDQIADPAWQQKTLATAQTNKAYEALAINKRNLKAVYDAGVRIGFGTDSGANPWRVPGIAEHRELTLLVEAGLTPLQAITLATRDAARLLKLDDRGVIAPGKRADLLVLAADPSKDIGATGSLIETWTLGSATPGPMAR